MGNTQKEWEVIDSYTAEEAINDGMLVDVSEMAKEAGFKWPVRITRALFDTCTPPKSNKVESFNGRLWDVLFLARIAITRAPEGENLMTYKVRIGRKNYTLWACIDGTSGPAIHIMHPEDY